jgi:hypothetical protein
VSLKAPLVVLWAVLIAGTTVASENHRLCEAKSHANIKTHLVKTHSDLIRLHDELKLQDHEFEVRIVTEVSETN